MRRRFFVVFNSTAGTSRVAAVARLVNALEAAGGSVTRSTARSAETARAEAAVAARSGDFDALVACGGDGTVRQVAAAAAGSSCPVGAMMLGTGNVLAHELTLPRTPDAVAAMLQNGPTQTVRMGLANGDPFLLMAGVGFDGRVIAGLNQRLKQIVAKAAYVPATFGALKGPLDDLTVAIDGHIHSGVRWAIITSANRYGGAFQLTKRTSIREDGLVAILFFGKGKVDLVRHNVSIALGRLDQICHHADSDVLMVACSKAQVTSPVSVPVQVDGDAFGISPLVVDAHGPTVDLIVPDCV